MAKETKGAAPAKPAKVRATGSAPAAAPAAAVRTEKVRALRTGYHDHERKREGDVFRMTTAEIDGVPNENFDAEKPESRTNQPWTVRPCSWVERVSASTPEKVTTPQEHLNREHDRLAGAKHGTAKPAGDDEGAADPGADPLNAGGGQGS